MQLVNPGRVALVTGGARGISFVASEHAGWVTGQVISVNGGFSMT